MTGGDFGECGGGRASGSARAASFDRPTPVAIPSLGLLVKYGGDVTITEAQTQRAVRDLLQGQVPIPEVFGWTKDADQIFIYMSLMDGETLQDRWSAMSEVERQAVCQELKHMAKAWRALKQDKYDRYVGSLDIQPLNDVLLAERPGLVGPFRSTDAVQQFHEACGIGIDGKEPIMFTHNDLVPPNILLSQGPNPRVQAIIDWGQAGWYPAYWEYCKARWVRLRPEDFSDAMQEEWHTQYLPSILDPVDNEAYYYPWLYFVLSKGI
ncbi:kinase-like domain-containing protein [Ilyonectria robusta]|uniref:kinase-like domain-containing protein n=1 Tax=Ilyonectria robusta TaxID=1079257 RepID=UPI001E8CDCBB|nr:kinase-like domain-containing protein [Ilyonectria robusta]KAH8647525.1 kinase-like domain-containing protein [Ilyonectria robusta]